MNDDCCRENLCLVPDTSISGARVARELDALVRVYGKPACIVSDNGTEFTSKAILKWANDNNERIVAGFYFGYYDFSARDNVVALVDYMHHPTTYDGETEIAELHPSMDSADIFTEMKNLSEDDMYNIAGHILMQPKIMGEQWGGGKTVR